MSQELSMEARLALIDQEIRTLHQFCVNKGYNPWQIEASAKPIFDLIKTDQRKTWTRRFGKLMFIIAFCLGLYYFDPAYRLVCSYGRRASIQVLPYWNWAHYYSEECFVENPFYRGLELTHEDCEMCETLEEIKKVENISQTVMAEDYIMRDMPVIVTDGLTDWQAKDKFNIHFLSQLYEHEESLKEAMPCMWGSNVRTKLPNPRLVLRKGAAGEITSWYAHWENCEKQSARFLRQFYKRPYFVPPMVEMGEPNWLFVSSSYKPKRAKPADIAKPLVLFSQLKGSMKMELTPRSPCNVTCSTLYATLHEGEILVLTDLMWVLDYSPQGAAETIAVGTGGFFD